MVRNLSMKSLSITFRGHHLKFFHSQSPFIHLRECCSTTYIFKFSRKCNSNSYRFKSWLNQNASVWHLSTSLMPASQFLDVHSTNVRFYYTRNCPSVEFFKHPRNWPNCSARVSICRFLYRKSTVGKHASCKKSCTRSWPTFNHCVHDKTTNK